MMRTTTTTFDDNRKTWALFIVSGGAMVMTIFAAYAMIQLRLNAHYTFWMGMTAMVQILIIFTGLLGLLVKRSIKISRSEVSISDDGPDKQS